MHKYFLSDEMRHILWYSPITDCSSFS